MLIEYVYKKIEQLIQVTITVNAVAQNKDKLLLLLKNNYCYYCCVKQNAKTI